MKSQVYDPQNILMNRKIENKFNMLVQLFFFIIKILCSKSTTVRPFTLGEGRLRLNSRIPACQGSFIHLSRFFTAPASSLGAKTGESRDIKIYQILQPVTQA